MRETISVQIERDGGRIVVSGRGHTGHFTLTLGRGGANTLGTSMLACGDERAEGDVDFEFAVRGDLDVTGGGVQ